MNELFVIERAPRTSPETWVATGRGYMCHSHALDVMHSFDSYPSGWVYRITKYVPASSDVYMAMKDLLKWMGPLGLDPEIDAARHKADLILKKVQEEA